MAQSTRSSLRSDRLEQSLENSDVMTDYAILSATSQDNTCGNNSPLTSEDEQNTDFALNDFKHGNVITLYTLFLPITH